VRRVGGLTERQVFRRIARQSLRDVPIVMVATALVTYFLDSLGGWGAVVTTTLMVLVLLLVARLVVLLTVNVWCWTLSLLVPNRVSQAQLVWSLLASAVIGLDIAVFGACFYVLGAAGGWWGLSPLWGGA
jgi:hypothetical protein